MNSTPSLPSNPKGPSPKRQLRPKVSVTHKLTHRKIIPLTPEWVTGFVDGDGCFSIIQPRGQPNERYAFVVSQKKRSKYVLVAMQEFFGCGSVSDSTTDQNMCQYRVGSLSDLENIIIPFFRLHPPRLDQKWSSFKKLHDTLFPNTPLPPKQQPIQVTQEWLIGLIDAEGSFYVSRPNTAKNNKLIPQFTLALTNEQAAVSAIQQYMNNKLGMTALFFPKKNSNNDCVQVSNKPSMWKLIDHCTVTPSNFGNIIGSAVPNATPVIAPRILLRTTKHYDLIHWKYVLGLKRAPKGSKNAKIKMVMDLLDLNPNKDDFI